MKNINLLLPSLIILLSSCGQNSGTDQRTKNDKGGTDILCFERISGRQKQDTAFIYMTIKGEEVSGSYEYRPFEKDARKGRISGIRTNDRIKGLWIYTQEGIPDSLPFDFKFQEGRLLQKQTSFDANGQETLPDTASYSVSFEKANCDGKE